MGLPLSGTLPGEADSNLKSRISKRQTLWLTSTGVYVLFRKKLFIGKVNKDESVTVARYRHTFNRIFPKIYTTWYLEQRGSM
ncbi:MAG: hypothetical protein WBB45_13735 [Cyclobacteriaceae bacterium]